MRPFIRSIGGMLIFSGHAFALMRPACRFSTPTDVGMTAEDRRGSGYLFNFSGKSAALPARKAGRVRHMARRV
jgi:hypothetical protein